MRSTFTSVDFEEEDCPPNVCGLHLIRRRPKQNENTGLAKQEGILQQTALDFIYTTGSRGIHPLAFGLGLHSQLSWLSSLLAHTADFGLINLHSHVRKLLIINSLPPPCLHIQHTLFYHISLFCALQILWVLFVCYKLEVCGNPVSSKIIGTFFQQHLFPSCLCHNL